jgi:hypothetical protein
MLHYNIWPPFLPDAGRLPAMNWVRSHIQHGSRLALLALAIQFVLSFGHIHGIADAAATSFVIALQGSVTGPAQPQAPSHHDADHDVCAICAVMAMAATALHASPPVLLPPLAIETSYQIADLDFVASNSTRPAFQPRAPPAS